MNLLQVSLHGPLEDETARAAVHCAGYHVEDRLVTLQASL
jgi:hypothetical protein